MAAVGTMQIKVEPDVTGFSDAVRLAMIKALLDQAVALLDGDSPAASLIERALATIRDHEDGKSTP